MIDRWGDPAMQRDMDLARLILLEIAARADSGVAIDTEITVAGHSRRKTSVHVMLLAKGGLIEARDLSSQGQLDWVPIRPTEQGYEFLDASGDLQVWNKAKGMIVGMGGAFSFDILRQLLVREAGAVAVL